LPVFSSRFSHGRAVDAAMRGKGGRGARKRAQIAEVVFLLILLFVFLWIGSGSGVVLGSLALLASGFFCLNVWWLLRRHRSR
jgi:Co/Zn/Cd efflux system component